MRTALLAVSLASLAAACDPDVGACDPAAATAVVYDPNGLPAFEGQALVIQSCGGGAFCHSAGIDPPDRHGAPQGFALDVSLASASPDVNEDAVRRLGRAQVDTLNHASSVLGQVRSGSMPPRGVDAVPIGRPEFQRIPPGARSGTSLPGIRTGEGQEILRNWLACGVPVVERTTERMDGNDNTIGATVPSIETTPVEPVWPEIYARILEPGCAFSMCHDDETTAGALDLSAQETAYAALLSPAGGRLCEGAADRVVPGDPRASLLVHKLEGRAPDGPICGTRMPTLGNALSQGRIASIRQWIEDGARREPQE